MSIDPKVRKIAEDLERKLMDEGLLVEAGWMGFKLLTIPSTAGALQLEAMRNCFFAGAQHLFASIISGLEEGDDASTDDLRRMENIQKELDRFLVEFKARYGIK